MKPLTHRLILVLTLAVWTFPVRAAQDQPAAADQAEAAYTKTIEKRAADVLAALDLKDDATKKKVHDVLIAQYRALRDWHDKHDPLLKSGATNQLQELHASLKKLHDEFVTDLSAVLSPDQVDKVKDKMTYNKVKVTYDAYCRNLPNLTETQKQKVLAFLKDAREEAMVAGSSDEKNKIFRKYKGRINNYLSSQGIDGKQADKESDAKPKAKPAAPSAQTQE